MSVEDRLLALTQQCRQQNGDGFLANASLFAPRLNAQAPDLHAEIRALAVAFEIGAAARINASPQPDTEAATVASEIAVRERLSLSSITPALAVARRIGPLMIAPAPAAPAATGWAGDSVAVGATPAAPAAPAYQQPAYTPPHAPHPQPHPQPAQATQSYSDKIKALSKNPMAMGALAVVLGFLVYQNMRPSQELQTAPFQQGGGDSQQPPLGGSDSGGQQPPVFGGGGGGGTGGGGGVGGGGVGGGGTAPGQMPVLGAPGSGPTLPVQQHQSGGPAIGFALSTPRGAAPGMVLLPAGGWQSGPVNFGLAQPGDTSGQSFATMGQGQFQLIQSGGHPVRLAQIQMSQDSLGIGNACVMFRGQQGQQDVQLSGADFCIMDGPCSRTLGCGRLQ